MEKYNYIPAPLYSKNYYYLCKNTNKYIMDLWIIWIIAAVVLLAIEVLSQSIWTLCLAAGCLAAMTASLCDAQLYIQIILLAAGGVVAYILFMPWFKKWHDRKTAKSGKESRTGMEALLGRHILAQEALEPGKTVRIKIDGDSWQAVLQKGSQPIMPGDLVTVVDYESIILTVRKVEVPVTLEGKQ